MCVCVLREQVLPNTTLLPNYARIELMIGIVLILAVLKTILNFVLGAPSPGDSRGGSGLPLFLGNRGLWAIPAWIRWVIYSFDFHVGLISSRCLVLCSVCCGFRCVVLGRVALYCSVLFVLCSLVLYRVVLCCVDCVLLRCLGIVPSFFMCLC